MKYILIFFAYWLQPYSHWQGITVEPFYSVEECEAAALKTWFRVEADGAVFYTYECETIRDMEV